MSKFVFVTIRQVAVTPLYNLINRLHRIPHWAYNDKLNRCATVFFLIGRFFFCPKNYGHSRKNMETVGGRVFFFIEALSLLTRGVWLPRRVGQELKLVGCRLVRRRFCAFFGGFVSPISPAMMFCLL